jgi:predicted dehydrogenase
VLATNSANKNGAASSDAKNHDERTSGVGAVTIGMIGAGGFSTRILLPAIKRTNVRLGSIASARGLTAAHAARKFGFTNSTSDYRTILADPKINAVFITTRHHQHAPMIVEALEAGKHVFVEKPLAIDAEGLAAVTAAARAHPKLQLAVGFNRRFSPHAKKLRSLLAGRSEAATMQMLINAGSLPHDHWTVDKNTGGGRMIGEGCHWFDLASYLVDAPITQVSANCAGSGDGSDNHQTVTLTMADGSVATLHYLVNGHKSFPKERLTVFCQGQVAEIDNFRAMQGYGWSSFNKMNLWKQDKGHNQEIAEFLIRCASGGSQLIEFDRLWNTTMATFATTESSRTCSAVKVDAAPN